MDKKRKAGRPKGSGHGYVQNHYMENPEAMKWMRKRVAENCMADFIRTAVREKIERETGKPLIIKA